MAVPPFKVKAIYEYSSEHDDDLNFPVGQIINVIELEGDDWYVGQYVDESGGQREGMFPLNFVEKYEPEIPTRPMRPTRARQDPAHTALAIAPMEQRPEDLAPNVVDDMKSTVNVQAESQPVAPAVNAGGHEAANVLPTSAISPPPPLTRIEPPPAPKPAPAEPAIGSTKMATAPPPIVPKSNAFKDRIAAFNKVEATPIKPMQPGRQTLAGGFIKKPFVAPPPSNTYVPPVAKQEPVLKSYVREEDPEIRLRQEQDTAAAEAAGLTSDGPTTQGEIGDDTPKPLSLKERMAMLQEQQRLQAERNMETAQRSNKYSSAPTKKFSESSDRGTVAELENDEPEVVRSSEGRERKSMDISRDRPRMPSASRQPMSSSPNVPEHEILSGGEEADQSAGGETTEDDDAETVGPTDDDIAVSTVPRTSAAPVHEADIVGQDDTAEDGEELESELDEEELRKQRLRERMARLAGPQGGAGPFNPFGAPFVSQSKKKAPRDDLEDEAATSSKSARRTSTMPLPGMHEAQDAQQDVEREPTERDAPLPPPRRSMTGDRGVAPPVPGGRPVPAPPSTDRVAPPVPPTDNSRFAERPPPQGRPLPQAPQPVSNIPMSPGPGSESDDELSIHARESLGEIYGEQATLSTRHTSIAQDLAHLPQPSSEHKRVSTGYFTDPGSNVPDKRASRVPPIPGVSGPMSPRPPPPPPPTAVSSTKQPLELRSLATEVVERGESDYEGDYDTDIASGAKHKEALKAHARDSSLDDSTAPEDTPGGTPVLAPRAPPPPAPHPVPKQNRVSMDVPKGPPPIPPPSGIHNPADDDYDPYSYQSSTGIPPADVAPLPPSTLPPVLASQDDVGESSADDVPPQRPADRAPLPPPHAAPHERSAPMVPPHHTNTQPEIAESNRSSMHLLRAPTGRVSVDQGRPSFDGQGQIASDVDLSEKTSWWIAAQPLPPELQARNGQDILTESEETTSSKRGGRTTITKDIYILCMDYSQTHITAAYDAHDPSMVKLSQEHEPPAPKLRQDQLESYWQRFGAKIAEAAKSFGGGKKDTVVGDGSSYSFPYELIKAQPDALLPVGTRAFGALVYANLANASTMQFDEIRPGDVITVRNARFEGHHGAMRQKYKQDYGPSHVAIVEEWDGTKRAVRAFEQGREKKGGVRSEKFRLGDLRSGEVRVWRVVGRDWVNWQSAS
nr:sh3 domain-containing protein c23a1.17 [Quercus suber]